jgi:glycylpeptide N-tetradecanoyltransferase
MFRFDYSAKFLLWALTPPGYHKEWHVGVRQASNKKLLAFITGVPARVCVKKKNTLPMAEINFLCVHKKLRSKRLAPVLIKEVTRRVNRKDQWQAVYTAGVVLPKPIACCRYWHRSLNPKKLIAIKFSCIGPRMNMRRTLHLYKLPDAPKIPNIQPMQKKHVPSCHKLLNEYLSGFDLHIEFSVEEVAHYLLPQERVVDSFVICDDSGNVTDLCSFYHLPSSIIKHEKYKTLNAAYSFYNIAKTVPLKDLMHDCLTLAKLRGCDVFNALDVMENGTFFKDLKFGVGDGQLQYYIYNWKTSEMDPSKVGLVLM